MHVINYTILDIAYTISKLSQFPCNLSMDHKKTVLKYLRYVLDYELHYTGYLKLLERYSDVNLISNTKDSRFIGGYVFTLSRAAIS